MAILALLLSCEAEGCSDLVYKGHVYSLVVKCTNCGTTHDSPVDVDVTNEEQVPNSRGTCQLFMKCRGCQRIVTFSVVAAPSTPAILDEIAKKNRLDRDRLVAAFECRGAEIEDWVVGKDFGCTSESGQEMSVDLSEGSWVEVDDDNVSCFISDCSVTVERVKM
ncbi:hypothetical protein RCL1_008261 [Eukaryota sp. TZLM3-RCL]